MGLHAKNPHPLPIYTCERQGQLVRRRGPSTAQTLPGNAALCEEASRKYGHLLPYVLTHCDQPGALVSDYKLSAREARVLLVAFSLNSETEWADEKLRRTRGNRWSIKPPSACLNLDLKISFTH